MILYVQTPVHDVHCTFFFFFPQRRQCYVYARAVGDLHLDEDEPTSNRTSLLSVRAVLLYFEVLLYIRVALVWVLQSLQQYQTTKDSNI